MTVRDALEQADRLVPNQLTEKDKLAFLNEVEGMVYREILCARESEQEIPFTPYAAVDETELLTPDPYSRLYRLYLESQIHYYNQEPALYNNALAAFRAALGDWQRAAVRGAMPRRRAGCLRFQGGCPCWS